MISQFFDRYVCSKRNGKCFLPWVCLGTQNNYANGQPKEKLKPKYGPNTKLFGVRFENVTNSSSEVSNVDHIQSASSLVLYFYHGLELVKNVNPNFLNQNLADLDALAVLILASVHLFPMKKMCIVGAKPFNKILLKIFRSFRVNFKPKVLLVVLAFFENQYAY